MAFRIAFACAFIFAIFGAIASHAQQACAPRAEIVAHLASAYGEHRVGAGLQDGAVLEIFANLATGTWTALVSRPDGVSCAVAAGEAWQADPAVIPGMDG